MYNKIVVLGDVHQKYYQMDKLNLKDKPVVQIGDLGFSYTHLYDNYNPDLFKVCLGNHDNYDNRPEGFDLGDFGMYNHYGWEFFFIRGAFSIDIKGRLEHQLRYGKTVWWEQEQLNREQMEKCYAVYKQTKPDVVFTHTCPTHISKRIGNPEILKSFGWPEDMNTPTQVLLEELWKIHEPKIWCFGHFHKDWFYTENDTTFICIDELNFIEFNKDWEIE
jgi:predicted phosphodiesterase